MKILILAFSGIGDALMFTPALKLLRDHYPTAQIDAMVMFKGVEELYSRNPAISNVYFHDFLKSGKFSSLKFVAQFRRKYDATINVYPANRWEYNAIATLISAKKRIGHEYDLENKKQLNSLNNFRIKEDPKLHNVEENCRLVKLLGVKIPDELPPFQIFFRDEDLQKADEWIREKNFSENDLIIGFHTGTQILKNHIKRRWAPEKFAELGKKLIESDNAKILLFGGPDEYELNDSISEMMNNRATVVKAKSLMASIALMKKCKLFVANDSALMHIASGLALPTVAVFAYTNPNFVYPWKTRHVLIRKDLPCSPCFFYSPKPASCQFSGDEAFKCNSMITVNEVFTACQELLSDQKIIPIPVL